MKKVVPVVLVLFSILTGCFAGDPLPEQAGDLSSPPGSAHNITDVTDAKPGLTDVEENTGDSEEPDVSGSNADADDEQTVIPLTFEAVSDEQEMTAMEEEAIGEVLHRTKLAWGEAFIFTKVDDSDFLYGGYAANGSFYELGRMGDVLELAELELAERWGKDLIVMSGVFGANAPLRHYFKIEADGLTPFLKVNTGNVTEADLDGDALLEIIAQHGMAGVTAIYRWADDKWLVAEIGLVSDALNITFDPERKLFYAYYSDGTQRIFTYTNDSLEETRQEVQVYFPEKASLSYGVLTSNPGYIYDAPQDGWELTKRVEGGAIGDDTMQVSFYKDENKLHAYATVGEAETLQMHVGFYENETLFMPLDIHVTDDAGHARYLLGCIYSPAIAGTCLEYAPELDKWYGFSIWGEPHVLDVGDDDQPVLMFQFQGKGNNFPDVTVVRWNGEAWEQASIQSTITANMNDMYWKALGGRISVKLYDDERDVSGISSPRLNNGPIKLENVRFEVANVGTGKPEFYTFADGGLTVLKQEEPAGDISASDIETLTRDLSIVEMFAEVWGKKEEGVSKQILGKWVTAYMDRLQGEQRYSVRELEERLTDVIKPEEMPKDMTLMQFVTGELYRYAQSQSESIQNDAISEVISEAEQLGYRFFADSGIYQLEVDYEYLISVFGDGIDAELYDYLRLKREESDTYFHGWVLQIDHVTLAEQILRVESFLEAYPDSTLKDDIAALRQRYVRSYFVYPMTYWPQEGEDLLAAIRMVGEAHGDTAIGQWSRDYLELLEQSGVISHEDDDSNGNTVADETAAAITAGDANLSYEERLALIVQFLLDIL